LDTNIGSLYAVSHEVEAIYVYVYIYIYIYIYIYAYVYVSIDVAKRYISDHGLLFNPSRTICSVFGKCTLEPKPVFYLDGVDID
jgi:hypothetical protein